ncbi:Dimethylaniline monooxygenase [N-oxide-forming] 1 [Beauveria bassiana]|nr:Dimethylaniline monooxygenase [N-oxide-forming] 1 [Beauveria bassiana]
MKVAIIGGGPSGLVTLKYLCEAHQSLGCEPVEAVLFEYQNDVGGTFLARAYEDAELVSSRQLTCFSDFRHASSKDFLAASEYVEYLRNYCSHFNLWPHIKLSTRVVSVSRGSRRNHVIEYQADGRSLQWGCDAVAICSGLHVEPNVPEISGISHAQRVMHSSQFKSRKQFDGCREVMVVGCGETGADVAYLAATHPEVDRVVLCHKDGFHFAPKRNPGPVLLPILGRVPNPAEPGIPIDVSRANLFDTAYVHRILRQKDDWLWEYYRLYITVLLWLSSGTTAGMDQWAVFFNKSMKVCPYISLPYRPQVPGRRLWLYALRSALVQTPVEDTNGRYVDLAPWPLQVQPSGFVEFVDNGRPEYQKMKERQARPDMMVLCTGYKQSFPFLDRQSNPPYATPDTANIRRIWERSDPSVGFIGFVRPSLGAIPPLSEMQAQLWIAHLLARHCIPRPPHPQDEWHYRLRSVPGARVQYGVDHESYVYQLALDMGSAPGLTDVVRLGSLKLLLVWALGANFNTKFRLRGPWRWDGASALLTSREFWATITRRPIIFGEFWRALTRSQD